MPAIHGGLTGEEYESFQELVEQDPLFDKESDAVSYSVRYMMRQKYGIEL